MGDWSGGTLPSLVRLSSERIFSEHGTNAKAFARQRQQASLLSGDETETALWDAILARLDRLTTHRRC